MGKVPSPIVLVVLDGWGLNKEITGNAIALANTPNMDRFLRQYPATTLGAAGECVGLPKGQMGNSEVGHLNLGAGRIVYQELTRISKMVAEGTFFTNPALTAAFNHAQQNKKALHLLGLLSDGGVHSHIEHLFALLELAKRKRFNDVFIHAFLDGRDTPPDSGREYIKAVEKKMAELGLGTIATVIGRYYAMDRDKRWERTELAYGALVYGEGKQAQSAVAAVEQSYQQGVTDEFVYPTVLVDGEGKPKGKIRSGDAIVFFNFRPDRARQLTRAFVDEDFIGFERGCGHPEVHFTCMTEYDATFHVPVAFPPQELRKTLGEIVAQKGLKQLRIAETEKYAHVTFFFNGGVETPFAGEKRRLISSPQVATYDQQPEMSAYEVTEAVLEEMDQGYDLVILNYANADMVGHTGVMEAAVEAVTVIDQCLGKVKERVQELGGTLLVTADHGNAEQMLDPVSGSPHTAHTTNPVPLILISPSGNGFSLAEGGKLSDVAPTILDLMGIEQPKEMTGSSLLVG
jgi:2,3-bisphosphoglycerate-independent phosphoglycerate mutase